MRTPIMAGNWKMNKTVAEARPLARAVAEAARQARGVEVIVAPPFTALSTVSEVVRGSGVAVAAQDMYWADAGAYTGAVSPEMVAELATHVILGHSERRHVFGEQDEEVHRKVHAALGHGLVPILCVGETIEERDAGRTDDVVGRQLTSALDGAAASEVSGLVLAYEPVWAIGTGRACDPSEAQRVIGEIRGMLAELFGAEAHDGVRILYGGSVNPDNIGSYLAVAGIDGSLVGGGSLAAASFGAMIRVAARD